MSEIPSGTTSVEATAPVLLTGAAGLLGRAVLARICPSRRAYAVVKGLPEQPLVGGATPIVRDLRQHRDIEVSERPETVVHLAQSPRYLDFPAGALDVFEVSMGATQHLLDWACRNGVRRFIYASSGGVYGHGGAAFAEDAPVEVDRIGEHFLATKRCGELLAESYAKHLTVIVLRLFFVYGPAQRRTMLLPRLVDNVLHGRPIILQGQDGMRLNPVYVDDAAAAIEAALALESSGTINVAGPQVLTLRKIGGLIGRVTGCEPVFEVRHDSDAKHLVGDTDKMSRVLATPRIDMAVGIRRMVTGDRLIPGGGDAE